MRLPLLALAALILVPTGATAGAWLQEPGTGYFRLSGGILSTDTRFDGDGNEVPFDAAGGGFRNTGYDDLALTLYGEVGIHRDWTVIADVTWKNVEADQPSAIFTTYGFGDIGIGVKRSLHRGVASVASVSVYAMLPSGYDPAEYPALGSDTEEVTASLQVGASSVGWWANAEGFFRVRSGAFRNQLGGAVGGGIGFSRSLGIRAEARTGIPVGDELAASDELRFDPTAVDPRFLDLAGTVSYTVVPGLALEGEVRSTVRGENTLKGTRFSFAIATSPAARLWTPGIRP